MLLSELVALEAHLGGFFARKAGQANDLVGIARLGVCLPRTVTRFAALILRAIVFDQGRLPMRSFVVTRSHLLVAGLAGLGAHVLRAVDRMLLRVETGRAGFAALCLRLPCLVRLAL